MAVRYQDNKLLSYDEWLVARNNHIGASILGTLVYGNSYSSSLELFWNFIGAGKPTVENIRMFLGTETQDLSAKCWTFYDGTEQSVVENARRNTPVKKYINHNYTYFNDLYPHLAVTPDGEIQDFGVYAGKGKGSLEIKNTQSWVLASYETGLPTDNVIQLCGQMMVAEYGYGNLFYFIDNSKFQCYDLERKDTKNIEELILQHTEPFWHNVLLARPLYNKLYEARRNYNQRLVGELENEIARLEPPPQNSTGYLNFLTERYKDKLAESGIIKGTDMQLLIAQKHKQLGKEIDTLEKEQMTLEIEIKNNLGNNNTLDFGKNGKITWIENKNGKRIFKNALK